MAEDSNDAEDKKKKSASAVYTEYMNQLKQWSDQRAYYYSMWNHYFAMQCYASYVQASNPILSPNTSTTAESSVQSQQQDNQQVAENRQNSTSSCEYQIPRMRHRIIAEIFDFFFLQIIRTVGFHLILLLFAEKLLVHVQSEEFLNSNFVKLIIEWEGSTKNLLDFEKYAAEQFDGMKEDIAVLVLLTTLFLLFTAMYEFISIWLFGATFGKYFMGIKVITCATASRNQADLVVVDPGTPVSFLRSLIRSLLKYILFSLMLSCFFFPTFSTLNRTPYDECSRTIVVCKRPTARRR